MTYLLIIHTCYLFFLHKGKHLKTTNKLQCNVLFLDGIDFFYTTESQARKMIDFLVSVLPVKYQHSKKLLSHDIHSNIYNYKFTYCVEIVPISKDSLVCLPKKLTNQLGSICSLCLVYRVSNAVHLIDVSSGQSMYNLE